MKIECNLGPSPVEESKISKIYKTGGFYITKFPNTFYILIGVDKVITFNIGINDSYQIGAIRKIGDFLLEDEMYEPIPPGSKITLTF